MQKLGAVWFNVVGGSREGREWASTYTSLWKGEGLSPSPLLIYWGIGFGAHIPQWRGGAPGHEFALSGGVEMARGVKVVVGWRKTNEHQP